MSKKRTTSTSPVKQRSSKSQGDPNDAAENRKFMIIMIFATVALVLALYYLLR